MVERSYEVDIEKWLGKPKIIILKGSRQVGKTTILKRLKEKLAQKQGKVIYFTMDKELSNPIFENPSQFIQFIQDQYQNEYVTIFLDEFQYINNAGLFLKVVYDEMKEKMQLIVSGSSSLEISKNSEFLTGRKIDFQITVFSFLEFLKAKSNLKFNHSFNLNTIFELESFNKLYSNELKRLFAEYLCLGGYPEIVLESNTENKKVILLELISTYIQKDIAGFLRIENISGYNKLIKILVSQIGNLLNKSELSNTLNMNHETVQKYLNVLEGTYVFDYLAPYSTNVRKEISKMPKVYIHDIGIKRVMLKDFEYNSYDSLNGSEIENYVYQYLKRSFSKENIYFYRTIAGSEIDFILEKSNKLHPVEIKFTNKVKSKHSVALKNFAKQYSNIGFNTIVTKDYLNFDKELNLLCIPVYLLEFFEF